MFKRLILKIIRFYQKVDFFHHPAFKTLLLIDGMCRYTPSCSEYTYLAVEKYGVIKGLSMGLKRITRCHPFAKGGYDPLK